MRLTLTGYLAVLAVLLPGQVRGAETDRPGVKEDGMHPGTIEFTDSQGNTVFRSADEVPGSVAWGIIDGVQVPVVRVEQLVLDSGRIEIIRYDSTGAVVDRTIGFSSK